MQYLKEFFYLLGEDKWKFLDDLCDSDALVSNQSTAIEEAFNYNKPVILWAYGGRYSHTNENIINKLADKCNNFIGFKDGIGDLDLVTRIKNNHGDRIAIMGGLPTAELYAVPMHSIGVNTYSSAVFNFLPKIANKFYEAVVNEDKNTTDKLINDLFLPIVSLRKRKKGYAVSMIKSGLSIIGKTAGHVRAPLVDLTHDEEIILKNIIKQFI